MLPATPADFDAYGRSYNETINHALAFSGLTVDYFTRVKADYFVELLQAHAGSSHAHSATQTEVIDIGCGIANAHPLLAGRVGRLAGVDISATCLAQAAAQNPHNEYQLYDGTNLPYPDRSFDAAAAACVFHHVPIAQRARLATDIRRVLRPGGLLVVFEHNPLNPVTRHVVRNCEFDKNAILLRRWEAEQLLGSAGFKQVYSRFILTVPAHGRGLRMIDRLFRCLPAGAQYYTTGIA